MKHLILSSILMLCGFNVLAGGDNAGNGGDACEKRFLDVQEDIQSWINRGGPNNLKLPNAISLNHYKEAMLQQISVAKISCSSEKVWVDKAEKTCKNYFSVDGIAQIVCNADRFMKTSESDQYVLVHHEFAGLAGFEVNQDETSNYDISSQISSFLEDQVVKKLAIIPNSNSSPSAFNDLLQQFNRGKRLSYSQAKGFFSGRCFRADEPNTPVGSMLADLQRDPNGMGPGFPNLDKISSWENGMTSPPTSQSSIYDDPDKFEENKARVLEYLNSNWDVIGLPHDEPTLSYEMDWLPFGSPDEKVEMVLGDNDYIIEKWMALTKHSKDPKDNLLPISYGDKNPGDILQMCYYFKKLSE